MASPKQIAANRKNALRSTGPRTVAGKKISRWNALKYGLTAELLVAPGESAEDFEAFFAERLAELDPVGLIEADVAENVITYLWRLRRVPVLETRLLDQHIIESHIADPQDPCQDHLADVAARFLAIVNANKPESERSYPEPEPEPEPEPVKSTEAVRKSWTDLRMDALGSDELEKLTRYETKLMNLFERAFKQLQLLQMIRRERESKLLEINPA